MADQRAKVQSENRWAWGFASWTRLSYRGSQNL